MLWQQQKSGVQGTRTRSKQGTQACEQQPPSSAGGADRQTDKPTLSQTQTRPNHHNRQHTFAITAPATIQSTNQHKDSKCQSTMQHHRKPRGQSGGAGAGSKRTKHQCTRARGERAAALTLCVTGRSQDNSPLLAGQHQPPPAAPSRLHACFSMTHTRQVDTYTSHRTTTHAPAGHMLIQQPTNQLQHAGMRNASCLTYVHAGLAHQHDTSTCLKR